MIEKDQDEHELEKIRIKKMKALMEAKKRNEVAQKRIFSISEKIDYILKVVLSQDAYNYLSNLKNNEPHIYQFIYNELISPDVIQNIDYLLALIRSRGGVPRQIPLDAIIYLERKAKGIKSKIQVQRGDDIMDLSSFLSK
jgi:DNA-binding TFAR19-related protein (PDSD5 family)